MEIRELRTEEIPDEARVPPGSLVMGVVRDGRVVALLGAFTAVFLDPLWVDEDFRTKSGPYLRPLWEKMRGRLREAEVKSVFGHADLTQPTMASLLKRLGGEEIVNKRQFLLDLR